MDPLLIKWSRTRSADCARALLLVSSLTEREECIAWMMAWGMSMEQIADQSGQDAARVKTAIGKIRKKLQVRMDICIPWMLILARGLRQPCDLTPVLKIIHEGWLAKRAKRNQDKKVRPIIGSSAEEPDEDDDEDTQLEVKK